MDSSSMANRPDDPLRRKDVLKTVILFILFYFIANYASEQFNLYDCVLLNGNSNTKILGVSVEK